MKRITAQRRLDAVLTLLKERDEHQQVKELQELWKTRKWRTKKKEKLFAYLKERYQVPMFVVDGGDIEIYAAYNDMPATELKRNLMNWST